LPHSGLFVSTLGPRVGAGAGGSLAWSSVALLGKVFMQQSIDRLLKSGLTGAAVGFALPFIQLFILGPGAPEERTGIRAFVAWGNAPVEHAMEWLGHQSEFFRENIMVDVLLSFAYWTLLGAAGGLVVEGVRRTLAKRHRPD
jgi:hypothetical protein